MSKFKNIAKAVIFALGVVMILLLLSRIFERKDSKEIYSSFYELEASPDVLILGTSHSVMGIQPMELWDHYGIAAYNLSGHGSQLATSYWVLNDALKRVSPKLVVVDASYLSLDAKTSVVGENQTHQVLDAIPFSWNKVRMVKDLFDDPAKRAEYLFDFIAYHDRWNDLENRDFEWNYAEVSYMGATPGYEVAYPEYVSEIPDEQMSSENTVGIEYMNRILNLCDECGIDVLMTYMPFPADEEKQEEANRAGLYAQQKNVHYINFLKEDVVDYWSDCNDRNSHLNLSGGKKVSDYIGQYITDNYAIPNRKDDLAYTQWQQECDRYQSFEAEYLFNQARFDRFMMAVSDSDYDVLLYIPAGSVPAVSSENDELWDNGAMDMIPDLEEYQQSKSRLHLIQNSAPYGELTRITEAIEKNQSYFAYITTDKNISTVEEHLGDEKSFQMDSVMGTLKIEVNESGTSLKVEGQDGNWIPDETFDLYVLALNYVTGDVLSTKTFDFSNLGY